MLRFTTDRYSVSTSRLYFWMHFQWTCRISSCYLNPVNLPGTTVNKTRVLLLLIFLTNPWVVKTFWRSGKDGHHSNSEVGISIGMKTEWVPHAGKLVIRSQLRYIRLCVYKKVKNLYRSTRIKSLMRIFYSLVLVASIQARRDPQYLNSRFMPAIQPVSNLQ